MGIINESYFLRLSLLIIIAIIYSFSYYVCNSKVDVGWDWKIIYVNAIYLIIINKTDSASSIFYFDYLGYCYTKRIGWKKNMQDLERNNKTKETFIIYDISIRVRRKTVL